MLAEMVGVSDPGLLIRRNMMVLKVALSGPMKYPSVAAGIEVVDAARRFGPGAGARRQIGEHGDHDRPGAEDRTFWMT